MGVQRPEGSGLRYQLVLTVSDGRTQILQVARLRSE